MSQLDLDDIQGLILRGYRRMRRVRHLVLRIDDRRAFKAVLGDLATEDRDSGPFVTVAADWTHKPPAGEQPEHCVNVGLTYSGLKALGVSPDSLESFPAEFREGAARRAEQIGDTGRSDPVRWIAPFATARHDRVHCIVSLFAQSDHALGALCEELRTRVAHRGGADELLHWDGGTLSDDPERAGYVHFGYRDGLSQPTIDGAPRSGIPDPLAPVPAGDFLLGHPSQRPGHAYRVPQPAALGHNGSFAAFRITEQDVHGFEQLLTAGSDGTPHGRELLAAQLCGRWRNGVPLVISPHVDAMLPDDEMNMFDFATRHPDPEGRRCPLGSHIRRANPRRARVMGGGGDKRRLVRRGIPYGPPYDPADPADGHERGLVGMFICVSLRDQFEFVMAEWINDGVFAPGLGRTRDPLTGNSAPARGEFKAPGPPAVHLQGLSSFVTTRAAAYCFLPSMTGLRHLAGLPDR